MFGVVTYEDGIGEELQWFYMPAFQTYKSLDLKILFHLTRSEENVAK